MPSFGRPPVVETVVGLHFQAPTDFTIVKRALFCAGLAGEFPFVEEKPPIEEVIEVFGEDLQTARPSVVWRVSDQPPSPRLWAKSADRRHTIQIQQDCLIVNWERSPSPSEPYWPYLERRKDFVARVDSLLTFFEDHRLGRVEPTSCFVTYINHIEYAEGADFGPLVQSALTFWNNETSDGWLPPVERADVRCSFSMPDQRGRLHVALVPAVRNRDGQRLLRLDVTARGTPSEPTVKSALDWIDLGHEWVVRGFTSLTRPGMHDKWQRQS